MFGLQGEHDNHKGEGTVLGLGSAYLALRDYQKAKRKFADSVVEMEKEERSGL